jgi:hypothetical protein
LIIVNKPLKLLGTARNHAPGSSSAPRRRRRAT